MNLFELFVKIGVDDQASGAISKITQGLGNGLKTAAKVGTAAVSAASAGIVALTKSAVDEFSEYEQLVGGVETLFKESAAVVQGYADDAFRTAGLSANEYMSTVTSFSASLLQSLGNDTIMASEYANMAIIDMSDNANKMGTSMEMIQNAYQGFAKANYTMLDNLKLGYGGTQAEMKRLIEDAAKLSDTVDAQSMSFANIVQAIHVVQTEMGITGTTAKEAGETIAGSAAAMEAAWKNLVTEVASGEGDVEQAFQNFTESAGTYAENLLPRIEVALGGISTLIESASGEFPALVDKAVSGIEEKLPDLLATGGNIVGTVVGAVIDNAPKLLDTGVDILTNFAKGVTDNLKNGSIYNATASIIDTAVDFLTDKDGKLTEFSGAAGDMVVALGGYLKDSASKIWDGAKEVAESFVEWFNSEEGKAEIAKAADNIQTSINTGVQNISHKFGEIGASISEWVAEQIEGFNWEKLWTGIGNAGVAAIERIVSASESFSAWAIENITNPASEGFSGKEYTEADKWNNYEALEKELLNYYNEGGFFGNLNASAQIAKDRAAGTLPDWYYEARDELDNEAWYIAQQAAESGTATAVSGTWAGSGNVYVTQNIYSQAQTAADLMEEAQYEQQRALLTEQLAP